MSRERLFIPGAAPKFPPAVLRAIWEEWRSDQAWRDDQARRLRFAGVRRVGRAAARAVRKFALDVLLMGGFVLACIHVFYGGTRLAEVIASWGLTIQLVGALAIFTGLLTLVGLWMAHRIEPEPRDEDGVKPGRRPR